LTAVSEALRVIQGFRLVIYGSILVFTVIFMPKGIIGLFRWICGNFSVKEID